MKCLACGGLHYGTAPGRCLYIEILARPDSTEEQKNNAASHLIARQVPAERPIYGLSPEDKAENERILRERSEGVYCRWEPPLSVISHERVLVIERVNGDCSVETFSCQESESVVISEFLSK